MAKKYTGATVTNKIYILIAFCSVFSILGYIIIHQVYNRFIPTYTTQTSAAPSPTVRPLPTGCELASTIFDASLKLSPDWKTVIRNPTENETLEGLFIMVQFASGTPLVGYPGNIVRLSTIHNIHDPLSEIQFTNQFERDAFIKMQKYGYTLIGKSSSTIQHQLHPEETYAPIGLEYIFLRDSELFRITLHSEDGNNVDTRYTCASDISTELNEYKKILTYPGFSKSKVDSIQIWDIHDNVYIVNVFLAKASSGQADYITYQNGKWILLYTGQEIPQCAQLEKYKVGKGLTCYTPGTSGVKTVTY